MFWPLPFKYCVRFKFSKGIKAAHYHCHQAPYNVFMYMMTVQPSSYCYSLHHFYLQNVEFTFSTKWPSFMLHIFWFSHLVLFVDEEIPKGLLTSQTECPTFLLNIDVSWLRKKSTSNCLFISIDSLEPIVHYQMNFLNVFWYSILELSLFIKYVLSNQTLLDYVTDGWRIDSIF